MIGRTVSHYRILSELGAGGMGVVYRAEDLSLGRQVAVKFLSAQLNIDPDARRRFVHEAKAAAALDHSGICTVYDAGEVDGRPFIAMALIEGETLRDRIARGPLPLAGALDIALQVAEALHEAHVKGVVHRDVKPANIMLTPKGQAKVMDFGLAQVAGASQLTRSGTTIGTAAYISPEQVRGDGADDRSDIWSLGVVLYEMVCGRRPFQGDREAILFHNLLQAEPAPLTGLRTGVPIELDQIVSKCLAKDAGLRYQHADELAVDLRRLLSDLEMTRTIEVVGQRRRSRRPILLISTVLLIFSILAIAMHYQNRAASDAPAGVVRQLTFTGDASVACWSPDGRSIAYARAGKIYIMPAAGGQARRIESAQHILFPWSWTNDGNGVLAHGPRTIGTNDDIVRLDVYGGPEQVLVENAAQPAMSPDGRTLAFSANNLESVGLCDLATGQMTTLVASDGPGIRIYKPWWLPDGKRLVYARECGGVGQELWIINRDGTGMRQIPTFGIQMGGHYCVTDDGKSLLMAGELEHVWYIWRLSLEGAVPQRLTDGSARDYHASASPDGQKVVFGRERDASWITLIDIASGVVTSKVHLSTGARHPTFSPERRDLFFETFVDGRRQIWSVSLDAVDGAASLLALPGSSFYAPTAGASELYYLWSSSGKRSAFGPDRSRALWKCAFDGGRQRRLSPDSLSVSSAVAAPRESGHVLYTALCRNDDIYQSLYMQVGDGSPELLMRESPNERLMAFDWGPEPGSVLLLLASESGVGASATNIMLDTREHGRRMLPIGERLLSLTRPHEQYRIVDLAMAPDRQRLALSIITTDSTNVLVYAIVIYDFERDTGQRLYEVSAREPVSHIAWSADGRLIAVEVPSSNSDLFVWEPAGASRMSATPKGAR